MATYTKIGRIRPDYADVWDSARSYTALEMVKSADGYHAYIAKQDVPAGTPLTDADYWGAVLDVSGPISESEAATARANAAAQAADEAREGIQGDLGALHDALRGRGNAIVCSSEGEMIALTDSSDDPLRGLRIFGKTTQDGTPTPDAPVPLVSVGESGSVKVTVSEGNLEDESAQTLTVLTPNGLQGIPVSSGGNYTDAEGQMWICDEIDLERGVYVQRVKALDGHTLEWQINAATPTEMSVQCNIDEVIHLASNEDKECRCMCNVFKGVSGYLRATKYAMSVISEKRLMLTVPYTAFGGAYADGNAANIVKINEWYQSLNLIDIIYQLATPVEIPLSAEEIAAYRALHTNKPNTTVFNDAGAHMAVEYNADAKTYIDNKFAELAAALVSANA